MKKLLIVLLLLSPSATHAALTDGLVGHWTFNGKDVNWQTNIFSDISGRGNNATSTGMSTSTAPTIGKLGQGLNFDGVNDAINVGTGSSLSLTASTTISAWVYMNSVPVNSGTYAIFRKYSSGDTNYKYMFSIFNSSGSIILRYNPGGGGANNNSNGTLVARKWYHVVVTFDKPDVNFYINGQFDVTRSDTVGGGFAAGSGSALIGAVNGPAAVFNGKMDDVRVYNRALSATEIRQLYSVGAAKLGVSPSVGTGQTGLSADLVGHWTFDGEDTNWRTNLTSDKSGQGNSGRMTSMSTSTSPVIGKLGQGLKFDGVDDSISLTNVAYTELTFSAWVKTNSPSQTGGMLFGERDAGTGSGGKIGYVGGNIFVRAPGGSAIQTASVPTDGNWHLITVTRNSGNSWVVYKDSVSTSYGTTPGSGTYNLKLIGANGSDLSQKFLGSVDDVRIYNRALSATEVRQLYSVGATKLGVSPSVGTGQTGLNAGLVGHWTFDGENTNWATGRTSDMSGLGNTGQMISMSTTTSPALGKLGQALLFNGSTSFINLGTPATLDLKNQHSVSAWVKTNVVNVTQNIFSDGHNSCCGAEFTLQIERNGGAGTYKFRYETYTNNDVLGNATVQTNRWYHVVGTWDGVTMKLYVDGVQQTDTQSKAAPLTEVSNSTGIGAAPNSFSAPFSGLIDDVRVYNRALSATEVQQLYRVGQVIRN